MDLKEIRKDINAIDDEMKNLFDKRLVCSERVADVKMQQNDSVFKPLREKEVLARFEGERWYQLYVRKVMQISRKYQYRQFYSKDLVEQEYLMLLGEEGEKKFRQGGTFSVSIIEDENSETGLSKYELLSLIADTTLEIDNLKVQGHEVSFDLTVPAEVEDNSEKNANSIAEARILCYMLYMESKKFTIK